MGLKVPYAFFILTDFARCFFILIAYGGVVLIPIKIWANLKQKQSEVTEWLCSFVDFAIEILVE